MVSIVSQLLDCHTCFVVEHDGELYRLKGYGYYPNPSNYVIEHIDKEGNVLGTIVTSDTTDNEDTYLMMFIPELNGLAVCGRKYSASGFIEVWKLDGTKVGSVLSPQGAYVTGIYRVDDLLYVNAVPWSGTLNGFYVVPPAQLLDNTKWTFKTISVSWPYSTQENRITVFKDKVLILRCDKGYNGDLIVYDPASDTFSQFDSWSGSGASRGFIFPYVYANDVMAVWTKAYNDDGFYVFKTSDLVEKVQISLEPFFDASLSGENQCAGVPVSDSIIAVLNTKDASTTNYLKLYNLSGQVLFNGGLPVGHIGVVHCLAGGYFYVSSEYFGQNYASFIKVIPDVVKTISATVSDTNVTVSGQNISLASAFKRFHGPSYANKVADIPLGTPTSIGTGYFRIRGR